MRGEEAPIAIDIGSRGVKVAQVVTRGDRVVQVRCGYGQLPQGFAWEPEKRSSPVEEALDKALEQAGVRGRGAICVLPRHQVTVRFTEFPVARPDDLAKMAALEAEQHIPLAVEETVVGYESLGAPSPDTGLAPALIVAARRPVVQGYLSLLSALNLQSEQITFDALCLFKMWQSLGVDSDSAFLLDLGARVMTINLIDSGRLRMSRTISGGGEDLTRAFQTDFGTSLDEAEQVKQTRGLTVVQDGIPSAVSKWMEALLAEIRRSAMAFGTQSAKPTKIYLSGGGSLLPGLDRFLDEVAGLKTSLLLPGQDLLTPSQGAVFALPYAASLAASQKTQALNLLLPEAVSAERVLRRRRVWTTAALAAGVALLTFIGGSYVSLERKKMMISETAPTVEQANQDLQKAGRLSKERRDLGSQLDFLTTAHKGRHHFLDILLEIHQRAPKGIWLTSMVMEKSTPSPDRNAYILQMAGKAPDNEVVADLVSALAGIPTLKEANLQSAKSVRIGTEHMVEFSLSCELSDAGLDDKTPSPEKTDEDTEETP